MTIEELQNAVVEFRDKRNWKQFHKLKDLAMDLSVEAAEVLEHFLWKNENKYPIKKSKGSNKKYTEL